MGERCPDGARGGMEMLKEEDDDDDDAFEEDPCFTVSASFSDPLNGEGGGGADDRTPKTVRLTDGFDNLDVDVDVDVDDEATES